MILPLLPMSVGAQQLLTESPELKQCMAEADGSDFQSAACIRVEVRVWDSKLNTAYKMIMASHVSAADKLKLRTEERGWILARDKACDPGPNPGSMERLLSAQCLLDWISRRAITLESYPL
jgi:uncharacterized protein YecT (DUF1311 family)